MYNDPIGRPWDSLKPSSSYSILSTLSREISCPSNFHGKGGQIAPFPKEPPKVIFRTLGKCSVKNIDLEPFVI